MKTHTLTLTDRQLACLVNCVQLTVVGLGRHPDAQGPNFDKMLSVGWHACDSLPNSLYAEVLKMLHGATNTITDESLTMTREKDIPFPGYVPNTGPFNATPRAFEDLTDSERDDFDEYYERKGFYHEHDPRSNDN